MIGKTISHYRIIDQLGRGGMGIVYRAEDTKLDRTVAIKVLPPAALVSEDDRARFYREAKAAAQLTHPHIAAVYEIDEARIVRAEAGTAEGGAAGAETHPFIAMEYIAGDTLTARIARGPMKLKEAVRIGAEIAEALKAAHAKDIVHRDIKSSNVMLDAEGRAKVLDFGLAKTTHSTMLTQMGSTLGTVAYMSPEQARGDEVDHRSDLWSLGILLYEMIAGQLPYRGDYDQAMVYAILNEVPEPLTAVRTGVPMGLEWIVSKCLAKDPNDRYQSASDLIVDLRNVDLASSGMSRLSGMSTTQLAPATQVAAPASAVAAPAADRRKTSFWPAVAVGALLAGIAVGYGLFGQSGGSDAPAPLLRVEIPLPSMRFISFPILSPNKDYLAVVGSDTLGREGIFLHDMATGQLRHLEGTEIVGPREIKFSPDGTRLAFTTRTNGGVFTVVLPSGLPERQTAKGRLAYWEDDETLLLVNDSTRGLTYRTKLGQRKPEVVPLSDPELPADYVDIIKTNIPGTPFAYGHQFVRMSTGGVSGTSRIFVANLGSGNVEVLESTVMNPEYVRGGFLMYQQRGDAGLLVVRRVDTKTGRFMGTPRDVLPESETTVWGQYSVTSDGDLLYQPRDVPVGATLQRLYGVDLARRAITALDLVMSGGRIPADPSFSPVSDEVALSLEGDNTSYVAVFDPETGAHVQKTFAEVRGRPRWSPDGRSLYYDDFDGQSSRVYRRPADGSGQEDRVLDDAAGHAISPDGRWLAAVRSIGAGADQSRLELVNLETGAVVPVDTTGGAFRPSFSPDGRFVAFDKSGEQLGRFLVVRPVSGEARFEISNLGARSPVWSPDGRWIYFVAGGIRRLPVRTNPTFQIMGPPELVVSATGVNSFDINRDGTQLVVAASEAYFSVEQEQTPSVVWLQNWSSFLEREMGR